MILLSISNQTIIEWIGYIASFIILISLLLRSIKRLRQVNLIGSIVFSVYGYLIGSYPVLLMNMGVLLINLYYLWEMVKNQDYFDILPVESSDRYTKEFITFYKDAIHQVVPFTEQTLQQATFSFFILRNMIPAGLFVVEAVDDHTLEVTLDFATPSFQDFKTGKHVYKKVSAIFKDMGYQTFVATSHDRRHQKYLIKMGFTLVQSHENAYYLKQI